MDADRKRELAKFLQSPPAGWLSRLSEWGKEGMVRSVIACAEWALPTPLGDDLQAIEEAVAAAERWCDDPSEANRVGARIAHEELLALRETLEAKGVVDDDFRFELDVAACAVECASESRDPVAEHLFGEFVPRIDGLLDAEHAGEVVRTLLRAWAEGKADPRA